MTSYIGFIICFVFMTNSEVFGNTRISTIIHPPDPPGPEAPICTSHSRLCHIAYNFTDTGLYHVVQSSQQMCRCPGNQPCETDWGSNSRSMTKVFKSAGYEVEVKMSYCNLQHPDIVCRQNEVAVDTRGRGAFTFEIASDFRCRCYRQMYAHRSWRDGDYDYIRYSCGKPRCSLNRSSTPQCTRITYNGSPNDLIHDYLCRCRWREECTGGPLPTADNPVVYRTCQPLASHEIYRRHRYPRP
ncbi:hypothetical protein ACF0H5_022259 [Mactra antiquata]